MKRILNNILKMYQLIGKFQIKIKFIMNFFGFFRTCLLGARLPFSMIGQKVSNEGQQSMMRREQAILYTRQRLAEVLNATPYAILKP